MLLREIAAEMGISHQYAHDLLADPGGHKSKARKQSYGGTCVDCGAPTSGYNGRKKAHLRCVPCGNRAAGAERKVWDREALLAVGRWWIKSYGEPPKMRDWWSADPAAPSEHAVEQAARYARLSAEGRIPQAQTVLREFGTWGNFMRALGYEPRPVGRPWKHASSEKEARP